MPVCIAEKVLWRALSEGHLTAEALDARGRPVDISNREWSYLQIFEESQRDVLKYQATDAEQAFTDVRFKRDELLLLWAQKVTYEPVQLRGDYPIGAAMIEPIAGLERRAYIPLCSALHWIMTAGGSEFVTLDDESAWQDATRKLFALIHIGDVELIGLPRGGTQTEKIPGHTLTLVRVLAPTPKSIEDSIRHIGSHIACTACMDERQRSQFNDQLFDARCIGATWSHLQVPKDEILRRWPRSESKQKPEHGCYRWLVAQPSNFRADGPN
jgi:hypothetical protein